MFKQAVTSAALLSLTLCLTCSVASAQDSTKKSKSGSGGQRAACVAKYKVWSKAFDDMYRNEVGEEPDYTEGEDAAAFRNFMASCMKYGPNSPQIRQIMQQ